MRLIDADALLEKWNKDCTDGNCRGTCWDCQFPTAIEELQNAPTIPDPRWHRVEEEMPEPHKDVLVSGMEAINNIRVYNVMVNDNGTWRPTDYAPSIRWDYWMPIEPPKEDA